MKILFIGDVVGDVGTEFLLKNLSKIKEQFSADAIIANMENCAKGNGVSIKNAEALYMAGVDFMTSGNHVFKKREIYDFLDEKDYIIRPANYPASAPGNGFGFFEIQGKRICVINLLGRTYMEPLKSPFEKADEILAEVKDKSDIIIVDFHAEATSEKLALANYLDGRVTAVIGTHTHVQTNDAKILPKGSGYITDAGMTGPINSILGVETEIILDKFLTQLPQTFKEAEGDCSCGLVLLELDKFNQVSSINNRIYE
ncbi:MAG: TIGR00282 family metallophosphoesterase [Clostridia bacterium]|nr:TIGR00282 family metallophosphoesterase [Clostridia bacterium]